VHLDVDVNELQGSAAAAVEGDLVLDASRPLGTDGNELQPVSRRVVCLHAAQPTITHMPC
jgi:hypothetical protein